MKILIIFMLLFSLSYPVEKKWYEYKIGNSESDMIDWRKSTFIQKIGTTAAMVMIESSNTYKQVTQNGIDENLMKLYSVELAICIDQSYENENKKLKIAYVATMCMQLMEYINIK